MKKSRKPIRSAQVPATSAMLYEMEERLNHRMDAGFTIVKSEIHGVRDELKSEIQEVRTELKSDIQGIKVTIHEIKSELHRVALLVEEQNARNKYVMDGYAQVYELLVQGKL